MIKKFASGLLVAAALVAPMAASAFVLGPTSPGKWGPPVMGTGATVTFSFMATGTSCAAEFAGCSVSHLSSFMPAGWHAQIVAAFAAWSSVANITFTEVADDGAAFNAPTASGDIRIGGHGFDGPGGTLAHGFYPPANGNTAAGDIHFDVADAWDDGLIGPGFSIFQVMAHEIGHAIGLEHTLVPASLMNASYTEAFFGPQADDIAGAQFIYGPAASAPPPPPPPPGVPEPMSLALVGLALGAAGFARRTKKA